MSDHSNLPPLNLPPINLKIKRVDDIIKVYDPLRDKYVALTPEEYVRQHFTQWLMSGLHFPKSLITNEIGINVNGQSRRCDTVVFNPDGTLIMIVEYKAPTVQITQNVFDQIARYNIALKAKYLVVSNGMQHYCCAMDYANNTYNYIPMIPDYVQLKNLFSDN